MHCILRRIEAGNDLSKNDEIDESEIELAVKHVFAGVREVIDSTYPDAYLAPLSKNVKKCTAIRSKYEAK
jgi:hypothetical protein